MKVVDFFKKNFKFIVIFLIIFLFNLICNPVNLDEVWNYGFANNIYEGLVPYRDFNMVLTPFYSFFMALPFFVFGSNMLVFHLTNALVITFCFVLIEKMLDDKVWIVFFFSLFPFDFCFPNYNMFLFILLCSLIYLEENYVKDDNKLIHYLIGFLLGIAVLTKQTVGGCLVLASLYYIKDFKVILKRIVGFIIPIGIFLVYLIFNGAFLDFIDLCVLGLIDFSGNNQGFNIFLVFYLLMLGCVIYMIKGDKRNIRFYYVLAFFSIAIPIVDFFHVAYVFLAFLLTVLTMIKKPFFHNEISDYMRKNKDKKIVFLSANAYYFKIVNDLPCDYLDLINRGNWGYHGGKKILKEVKKEAKRGTFFFINDDELAEISQTDKDALSYVIKNAKKIDSIRIYDIYEFQ